MGAAFYGNAPPVEHMLASLRQIQDGEIEKAIKEATHGRYCDRKMECAQIVNLLEDYMANPFETVKKLRRRLKLEEYGPVSFFFKCDFIV